MKKKQTGAGKQKITVIDAGGQGKDGAWWHVHRSGCQDIASEMRKFRSQTVDEYEVEDVKRFIKDECENLNADHGEGVWDESHFHLSPCVEAR